MGVLKCTIGGTDVSQYLKGLSASPGGDGREGNASLTLDKEAAGLDIRAMMPVAVWETFDSSGNGVASRGRLFGGLVVGRDTSNIGTTKTWQLNCADFNYIGTRGIWRDMEPAKAVTLTADTFKNQVIQLTQILQYNGALSVKTEIDAGTAVSIVYATMPGVTYEGGHEYFWYLGQLCQGLVALSPAVRPTFYLGTSITVGVGEDFGVPTLYLFDKAASHSAAFVFTDVTPPPGGEYNLYDFKRKSAGNELTQRVQIRTPSQVLTGFNSTAAGTYENPYINHGVNTNAGAWMGEPITNSQVVDNTEAQALVDRKVESAGYPRDSYDILTDQRLRNGEYVDLTWSLEGLSNEILQVVETEYTIEPPLEVWVRATLNARRLRYGESADDDIYAPPVEGDNVPPLPPENLALASNLYNPATGKTELVFTFDPSPSPDAAYIELMKYAAGGYFVAWRGEATATEGMIEVEPGSTFEVRGRAVDTSNNIGPMTDPPITGTAASPPPSDLLVNGGFELNAADDESVAYGYMTAGTGTTTRVPTGTNGVPAYQGAWMVLARVPNGAVAAQIFNNWAFAVPGPGGYRFALALRSAGVQANAIVELTFRDAAYTPISTTTVLNNYAPPTGSWSYQRFPVTAPANTAHISVSVRNSFVSTPASNSDLYIDAMSLVPQQTTEDIKDASITTAKLAPTGVSAQKYEFPSITLGVDGRATAASSRSGTSFPGSPSLGDFFYRTDLGVLCWYDGTRWLGPEFKLPMHVNSAGAPYSVTNTDFVIAPIYGGRALYLVGLDYSWVIPSGSHTIANYWTMELHRLTSGNADTTLASIDTDKTTVGTWVKATSVSSFIVNPLGTTDKVIWCRLVKTGTPGNIQPAVSLRAREVYT